MPRPVKQRRICFQPGCRRLVSGDPAAPAVELKPDELEALRLSDLEELEQTEVAVRMGISRGTVQRLLYSARKKLAFALVAGHSIDLEKEDGSETVSRRSPCQKKKCCRFCYKKIRNNHLSIGESPMKIAVTCENNQVFQHFGHTPEFAIFEIEDGRISGMKIEPTEGSGHGALAGFLAERGVDILLCGGIGGGAQMALAEAGIKLVGGVQGDVTEAVGKFLMGTLNANPNFSCNHHHEEGHTCGDHTCGHGNCHGGNH